MLIDSHCHLPDNLAEAEAAIKRAKEEGVLGCINIGTSLEDNIKAAEISDHFLNVHTSIGIYPNSDLAHDPEFLVKELEKQVDILPKIVAIGECGLDITDWEEQRPLEQQLELFERQLQLAIKKELPVIIHNRNGGEQIIELLNKYVPKGLRGVAHCFDSTWELAVQFLDNGFYISFSGFITYKSKDYLLESVEKTPLDKILVETDAPYILPKGIQQEDEKGAKILNEPKNVKIIARKVAETKNIPLEEIAEATNKNTSDLFGIDYGR